MPDAHTNVPRDPPIGCRQTTLSGGLSTPVQLESVAMRCPKRSTVRLIPKNPHGQSVVRQDGSLAMAHAGRAASEGRAAGGRA